MEKWNSSKYNLNKYKKMEELTQEQVQSSIAAAYDSVSLINELQAQEVITEEEVDTLSRNKEHISIMLGKDWFVGGLTAAQKTELESIV